MTHERYQNLNEFWGYYVQEHSQPLTRQLHFIGNMNLFLWLLFALWRRDWRLIVWSVISSYGFAWIGHFFVEKNRPATFEYPLMSAVCDMRMYYEMWRGTMDAEIAKYAHPVNTQDAG